MVETPGNEEDYGENDEDAAEEEEAAEKKNEADEVDEECDDDADDDEQDEQQQQQYSSARMAAVPLASLALLLLLPAETVVGLGLPTAKGFIQRTEQLNISFLRPRTYAKHSRVTDLLQCLQLSCFAGPGACAHPQRCYSEAGQCREPEK